MAALLSCIIPAPLEPMKVRAAMIGARSNLGPVAGDQSFDLRKADSRRSLPARRGRNAEVTCHAPVPEHVSSDNMRFATAVDLHAAMGVAAQDPAFKRHGAALGCPCGFLVGCMCISGVFQRWLLAQSPVAHE